MPLGLVTAAVLGWAIIDNGALLEKRKAERSLDTSKPFKINVDTNSVCKLSLPLPSALPYTVADYT